MSLEEKLSRIRKLSQIQFPSDQELDERARLEDEVELFYNEERNTKSSFTETRIPLGTGKLSIIPTKREKKSIFDILISKLKKKPVTFEEIERLTNERKAAILKRDIAKAKYDAKHPEGKGRASKMKFFSTPKESRSSAQDFRSMTGNNDPKKYKGLTG